MGQKAFQMGRFVIKLLNLLVIMGSFTCLIYDTIQQLSENRNPLVAGLSTFHDAEWLTYAKAWAHHIKQQPINTSLAVAR